MAKLGYKWYPKDWKTNEKVFKMRLELRGFYRELIDFAYENDNNFEINEYYWIRLLGITRNKLHKLLTELEQLSVIINTDGIYSIPTVEPRIQLIRGGKKGGQISKPPSKPSSKHDGNQIEIEIEIETKIEKERLNLLIDKSHLDYTEEESKKLIELINTELLNSYTWIEKLIKSTGLKESELKGQIFSYLKKIYVDDKHLRPIKEIKEHCHNWINKNKSLTNGR